MEDEDLRLHKRPSLGFGIQKNKRLRIQNTLETEKSERGNSSHIFRTPLQSLHTVPVLRENLIPKNGDIIEVKLSHSSKAAPILGRS